MAKFKLSDRRLYWWPVTANIPSEAKAGDVEKQTLQLQFEAMNTADSVAWDERVARESPNAGYVNDADFLVAITKDWKDVLDENDRPVPFSEEAYREALKWQWFRLAAMKAYFASIAGEKARLGN